VLSWNDASGIPLDWNGPVDRAFDVFPDQAKARPIIELLEASVHRFPERVAIVDSEASITYAEIWRASVALAEQIAEATVPVTGSASGRRFRPHRPSQCGLVLQRAAVCRPRSPAPS
jgi:hypothetical protein